MAAIEAICLPSAWRAETVWAEAASAVQQWLRDQGQGVSARDTIVLLPFAALLQPCRAAFAALGGWQPRVETALTLAAAIAPPAGPVDDASFRSGDPVQNRLSAAALLGAEPWAQDWASRDPTGFAGIVAQVVDAAQTLADAAAACAPNTRAAWWTQVRLAVHAVTGAGPAAAETSLLRVALEWAAASLQQAPPPTDVLFSTSAVAWVVMRVGGPDAVADAVVAHQGAPTLCLSLDPADDAALAEALPLVDTTRTVCEDFEAEAQAAATAVLQALNAGQTPVALVALDRALARRIRALLDRFKVPLVDETGWLLATTHSAAALMALLRAASLNTAVGSATPPGAACDPWLNWLKTSPHADKNALDSLEALWRNRRHVPDRAAAQRLWVTAQKALAPLHHTGQQSLHSWLAALHGVLQATGLRDVLLADGAGTQVLAALRLPAAPWALSSTSPWPATAAATPMRQADFVAWVAATLEQAPYLPLPDPNAQVVLTPLARAFGRPFGHVVLPGADHQHLGAIKSTGTLISDSLARQLGLPHNASRRQQQRLALAHSLRSGKTTVLRRLRQDGEPLAESPDLAWLMQLQSHSEAETPWSPPLHTVPAQSTPRPLPMAPNALPAVLSASQLEALRQCPYRFFARAVLRLDEPEELDLGVAKRDYGSWLHAVLHQFHVQRDHTAPAAAQLEAAAQQVTTEMALDEGELLPFRAGFEHFAPAYLAWLAQREAEGWFWADGESDHHLDHPEVSGLRLKGRIDRLDHGPNGQRQLIDYKTGSISSLKSKVKVPLEDTQLAFYGALLSGGQADPDLQAMYLALDDAGAPRPVEHAHVSDTAITMIQAVGDEWQRMRGGAVLPALGEGPVCDNCEARGLCRRDHWA